MYNKPSKAGLSIQLLIRQYCLVQSRLTSIRQLSCPCTKTWYYISSTQQEENMMNCVGADGGKKGITTNEDLNLATREGAPYTLSVRPGKRPEESLPLHLGEPFDSRGGAQR